MGGWGTTSFKFCPALKTKKQKTKKEKKEKVYTIVKLVRKETELKETLIRYLK